MQLGLGNVVVNFLLYANDLVVVARHPSELARRIQEIEAALDLIGLALNASKTAHISSGHFAAHACRCLPGECHDLEGIVILGRRFFGSNHSGNDMDYLENKNPLWGRCHCYKTLLKHHTTLSNTLLILEMCMLQTLLWQCCTWKANLSLCSRLRGQRYALLRAKTPRMIDTTKVNKWNTDVFSTLDTSRALSSDTNDPMLMCSIRVGFTGGPGT